MKREIRSGEVEFRLHEDEGKTPMIVGYAAVFDRASQDLGGFTEFIRKGAFREALKEAQDVRALFNHEAGNLLGRTSSGTLRLSEDDVGLRMEIDVPDTQIGRDVRELVRRGDVTGASFAFSLRSTKDADGDRWYEEDGKAHRELLNLNLADVGPVTYPAYVDTQVSARSMEKLEELKAEKTDPDGVARRQRQRDRDLDLL